MSESTWFTAQQSSTQQRKHRYGDSSFAHPGKMLPDIARRVIEEYSQPGEIVCDPMCGIGTTLVESQLVGRNAIGIEFESKWAQIATANIGKTRTAECETFAHVYCGDSRQLRETIPREVFGGVSLILTSPPYGAVTHGRAKVSKDAKVAKWDDRYSTSKDNLGESSLKKLYSGLVEIYEGCYDLLKPGGYFLQTTRPWRRDGTLIDFPGKVAEITKAAGFAFVDRKAVLLAGVEENSFKPRAAFFQILSQRRALERGMPHLIPAHEDLLIFRKPL